MPSASPIAPRRLNNKWEYGFAIIICLALLLSVGLYNPLPALIPASILFSFFAVSRPAVLFGLFFFLLPFSIEFELPGGLSTDLPSEPLMIVLSVITLLMLVLNAGKKQTAYIRHPITLVLIAHIFWIFISSFTSGIPVYSFKFLLAKLWYVLPFYFLPLLILSNEADYRFVFKCLLTGLLIAAGYVMLRHAGLGFSFKSINEAVKPIFRNHVNYGVMLVIALPYMAYLYKSTQRQSKLLHVLAIGFLVLAIYLTYTRAAQLSIVIAICSVYLIRKKLIKAALLTSFLFLSGGLLFLASDNSYLDMAPDYTRAIEHTKFDNLVEATAKMEDISTVERFYRWIAGINMISDKPLTGFGPSTFYESYRPYTITSYKTYVSDNPEKSGIHNYYLMTAAEQGLLGLLIFVALCVLSLLYAEKNYHRRINKESRALLMASAVSLIVILAVLLINDLLEADKVGPFFFLCMAIVVAMDLRGNNKINEAKHEL